MNAYYVFIFGGQKQKKQAFIIQCHCKTKVRSQKRAAFLQNIWFHKLDDIMIIDIKHGGKANF